MRTVYLNRANDTSSSCGCDAVKRRTGHLLARMKELEEYGLTVAGQPAKGVVTICFSKWDNGEACRLLEDKYRVLTEYDAGENQIRMRVTAAVTFEDLDYVQGAVTQLLS